MNYLNGRKIKIGDTVIADGADGVVICSFDDNQTMDGFEDLLISGNKSGELDLTGVIVRTEKYGDIHYRYEDRDLIPKIN